MLNFFMGLRLGKTYSYEKLSSDISSDLKAMVLTFVSKNPYCKSSEIAEKLNLEIRKINPVLLGLINSNVIQRTKDNEYYL